MPSMNKVRISNVIYDAGAKFYDDFVLDIDDRSFLIEYTNGGGKTFLAQCIMQCILPKSHFTEKHPFKELYSKENNNNTIHSLIEWKLEEGNGYDYMITGFCSRKKVRQVAMLGADKEDNEVDTFNYVCFYNEGSKHSIDKLPLKEVAEDGKISRMSYSNLRKYLKELGSNPNDNYVTEIFDTTTKYHKFIKDFKINATEWELIKDVNRKEAYVSTYFDNYKSAKAFIREFLIPKIDEANKLNNSSEYQSGEDRAESLLAIKDTIIQYSKKLDSIKELDVIRKALESIVQIDKELLSIFESKENIKVEIVKGFNKIKLDIELQKELLSNLDKDMEKKSNELDEEEARKDACKIEIAEIKKHIDSLVIKINELNMYKKAQELSKKELSKAKLEEDLNEIGKTVTEKKDALENLLKKKDEYYANNKYIDYLDEKTDLLKNEEAKKNYEKSHEELMNKLDLDGGNYKYLLSEKKGSLANIKNDAEQSLAEIRKTIDKLSLDRDSIKDSITTAKNSINNEKLSIERVNKDIKSCKSTIEGKIHEQEKNKIALIEQKSHIERVMSDIKVTSLLDNEDLKNLSNSITSKINDVIEYLILAINSLDEDIEKAKATQKELSFIVEGENYLNDFIEKIHFSMDSLNVESFKLDFDGFALNIVNKINSFIEGYQNQIKAIETKITNCNIALASKKEQKINLEKDAVRLSDELSEKKCKLEDFSREIGSISLVEDRYELPDRYEASYSTHTLEEVISNKVKEVEFELLNSKNDLKQMKSSLDSLKENKGLVLSKDLLKCFEDLDKNFDNVLLGADFLKNLTAKEKEYYLEKSDSLVAYSILVPNSIFNKILNNESILDKYKDKLIPIINMDSLKNDSFEVYNGVYLTHRSVSDILDEDKIKKDIENKEAEIQKLLEDIKVKEEFLKAIKSDLNLVVKFNRKYPEDFESNIENDINALIHNKASIKSNINDVEASMIELDIEKDKLNDNLNSIKELIQMLDEQLKPIDKCKGNAKLAVSHIEELEVINSSLNDTIKEVNSCFEIRTKSLNAIDNCNTSLSNDNNRLVSVDNNIGQLNGELSLIQDNIAKYNSEIYNVEALISKLNYEEVKPLSNISLMDAETIYTRTLNDSMGKISEVKLLDDNISKIKLRMKSFIKEIERYGFNVSYFEDKDCEIYSDKAFETLEAAIVNAKEEFKKQENVYKDKEIAFESAKGRLSESIVSFEKKYKVKYEAVVLPEFDIEESLKATLKDKEDFEEKKNKRDDEIELIDKNIKQINLSIKDLSKKRTKYNDELMNLNEKRSSIENIIANNSIDINSTTDIAESLDYVSFKAKRELEVADKKIAQVSKKHTDKVESARESLAHSTFNFAEDLNEVKAPGNLEDCKAQIEDISGDYGYISLLEEEKKSLEGEMLELEGYQDSFIDLCVQRCNYALDKLLDIEEYSKVDINGNKMSAIMVELNPLPEDERKIKMRNYIMNLINDVDSFSLNDDKMKEFSKLLELKNLFPQILSDINKCSIKIYKINNTCDGGKYINWGEAGSTGQTNSMYVYFFMCIIVYLRRLSSFNVKEDSRKFIILDSPFNGTVATNLWKIPLELMRKNNVQLMCLGYLVPAHLTGLFDARFSLGDTKMSNGVNQVGVVKEEVMLKRSNSLSVQEFIYGDKIGEDSDTENVE